VAIVETEIGNGWFDATVKEAVVHAPAPLNEALRKLPAHDRKRIAEAITSLDPKMAAPEDIRIELSNSLDPISSAIALSELLIPREMMISVATGGDRIQDVDDYYKAREIRLRTDLPDGVGYKNPFESLWDWYAYWGANLPQYKDRRLYIRQLFGPAIESVCRRPSVSPVSHEPTGWERVDRDLAQARALFNSASAEQDYQAIGLLCREIIVSLGQAVDDSSIDETQCGVTPSTTDTNRLIDAFGIHALSEPSNEEIRAHARASLALALSLQHQGTTSRQLAALCLEATSSTTAVISIIARGVRN